MNDKQRLSRLDHLRFYAAALVIFHHTYKAAGFDVFTITGVVKLWINGGAVGVTLFMVLSGFLFSVITDGCKQEVVYGKFLLNRILRIAPLTTFVVFIVIAVNRQDSTPIDILRLLTLQLNTGHSYSGWGHAFFPSGPIWTIAVEFQFYLLFPFICMIIRREGVKWLLLMTVVMVMTKASLTVMNGEGIYNNLYHTIIGRLDQFLVGIAIGIFYSRGYFKALSYKPFLSYLFLMAGMIICSFAMYYDKRGIAYNSLIFLVEAVAFAFIVIGYLHIPSINRLAGVALRKLGDISFSLYLLHLPIASTIVTLYAANGITRTWATALVVLGVSIPFSLLTYHAIERPFLSLKVGYKKSPKSKEYDARELKRADSV